MSFPKLNQWTTKALTLLFIIFFYQLTGQNKKEIEQKRKKTIKEIEATKKILAETKQKKEKSELVFNTLNTQINKRTQLITEFSGEIEAIDLEINKLNDDVSALNFEINKLKKAYSKLVYEGYKTRSSRNKINFLFSANNFNDAFKRINYLNKIMNFRKNQIELIQKKKQEKAKNLVSLEQKKQEKLGLVSFSEQEKIELEKDKISAAELLKELKNKEISLKQDLEKKKKAAKDLEKALQNIIQNEIKIAKQRAKEQKTKKTTIKSTPKKITQSKSKEEKTSIIDQSQFAKSQKLLKWPVNNGFISQGFGTHQHPSLRDITVINNGVNISTMPGSTARAVFEGEVTSIVAIPGLKNTIIIRHGNYFTVYSKIEDVYVQKGDFVSEGSSLGKIFTDEEHHTELHFEIWNGNQRLNPELWLLKK